MNVDTITGSQPAAEVDISKEAYEEGNTVLMECFGGCKKKILIFGPVDAKDWGEGMDGALCLECKAKGLKSGSIK